MSSGNTGLWRLHGGLCAGLLGLALVLALWLMSDPGTSIGAMLAVGSP